MTYDWSKIYDQSLLQEEVTIDIYRNYLVVSFKIKRNFTIYKKVA